jgi:hypothetical protein
MDPTTILGWLIGLSAWLFLLTFTVALDLRRAYRQSAADLARAMEVNEAGLEQATGPNPVQRAESSGYRAAADPDGASPRGSDLLAPPPMIGGDTLRDWLIHYRKAPEAWADVTREFYRRAAAAPAVADYFVGVDWPQLQRHFTAALILITHTGVTRDLPATASRWHHGVRNSHGDPITPQVYDAVINTLVGVLRDFDVPEDALAQLGRTVAPFRMAIARERVPSAEQRANQALDPSAEQRARATWPAWRDQRGDGVQEGGW